MTDRKISVKHREARYAEHYATNIWHEIPSSQNPFVEEDVECYGYPLEDLVNGVTFPEMVFLLIKGELPVAEELQFLNRLMVAFSHPGVRHEASRAAVMAGVPKTLPEHVLPISLMIYGGARTGCSEMAATMKFYARNRRKDIARLVTPADKLPGFRLYYGDVDVMALRIADWLIACEIETPHLEWGKSVATYMAENGIENAWSKQGVAAAAFCDLGIPPRYATGLVQCMAAPGLLAQGMENANKPPTVLPFVDDSRYELVMEE